MKDSRGNASKMKTSASERINLRSFYKLMLNPEVMKLRLPVMFARAFGDELSDACDLTFPSGETYQVGLVKENSCIWFEDGWEEVVNRYSIGYGYFLGFAYIGNSKFNVYIFDLTGCEILYEKCDDKCAKSLVDQHGNREFEGSQGMESDDSDDDVDADLEDDVDADLDDYVDLDDDVGVEENMGSLDLDDNGYSDDDDVGVENMGNDDFHDESDLDTSGNDDLDADSELEHSHLRPKMYSSEWGKAAVPRWMEVRYEEEMKVVSNARLKMPANPFFLASIKPSSNCWGTSRRYFNIPIGFVRDTDLHIATKDYMKVEMSDGREWLLGCCRRPHNQFSFGKGWLQLAQDIGLDTKDVCLFELIDATNWVFKLTVVKAC